MESQQTEGFIGSRLRAIPHSSLIFATSSQLLLLSRRQLIRLDLPTQTLVYSNAEEERLIHATYHAPLELYLLLSEKNLIVVNSEGQLIKRLPNDQLFGAKFLFVCGLADGYRGEPNHRNDYAVFVKGDHLYSCPLAVFFERQLIKNRGICDFGLQLGTLELHESPEYIQNAKWLREEALLVLWNAHETYVYALPQQQGQGLKRLHIYNKISRRENLSLDYAVSLSLKLMTAGFQSGTIKVYHFDESRKYLQELRGHQGACLSLLVPPNASFLYSASADSSVRIWNLQDFEQVYCLQLDLLVADVHFVNAQLLFVGTVEAHGRTYLCELNTDLLEPIVNQNRGGELQALKCDGQWCIAIYSNNHVEFLAAVGKQQPNLAHEKIQYPEKYGSVRDVYALQEDTYAIALERGFSLVRFNKRQVTSENFQLKKLVYNQSIAKAREQDGFIELIHEKLLGTYLFNVLSDWKDIPVSIKVTYVYFHSAKGLPKWDCTTQAKPMPLQQEEVTYCVLGSTKGEIYFVDIDKRSHYHTKVYFHTCDITFIRQITDSTSSSAESFFLSMSKDKQLVVWKLSPQEPPTALATLSFNRDFTYRELYANFLVLGEKSGELNIIQILTSPALIARKSANTVGHIRAVICGDYMEHRKQSLFLSGGEDSVIKIWRGVEKVLLFQLKLFGIVSAVCFTKHSLDLIVCHNEQISILKDQKLKSLKRAAAFLTDHHNSSTTVEEIDIRQFFYHTPASPLPKQRLNRLTSRYANLFHKVSFKEEQLDLRELKLEPAISLPPTLHPKAPSFQRLESLQKLAPKSRRFHINSSIEATSEISLPRINTKNTINEKVLPSTVRVSEELKELKALKNRSYSNAGRG